MKWPGYNLAVPDVTCPRCRLAVHSAPGASLAGECPRCATALPGRTHSEPAGVLGEHELGVHDEVVDGVRVIELWGELTKCTASALEETLEHALLVGPFRVVLDLAPLARTSGAVVPLLAATATRLRARGGDLVAAAAPPAVRPLVQEALGTAGHPTTDAAIAALAAPAAAL